MMQLFCLQVDLICRRIVEEHDARVRECFDQVLHNKLAGTTCTWSCDTVVVIPSDYCMLKNVCSKTEQNSITEITQ